MVPLIVFDWYQPASAGNLLIPAKLPVNRWDTTLVVEVPALGEGFPISLLVRVDISLLVRVDIGSLIPEP